jgi:hypothetical protein
MYRHSERRPNHFLGAPGPADVLLRFLDRNGKIVFAPIVSRGSTGWAPGNPIPTDLSPDLNMVKNPELHANLRVRHSISSSLRLVLGHNGIATLTDQRPQGIFR